uniref:Uncharacterized protein n=1 Tax=Ditylenchus dipsaci TaxID=166011 RepID=A0A915DYM6_9BILA
MNTCSQIYRNQPSTQHDYQRAQVESTQPAVNNTSETSYTWYLNELEIDPSNYDTSKQFKFVSNHEILMIPNGQEGQWRL